jgi:hypothetical protein
LANSLAAAQLPLVFEPNVGQARGDVRFVARAGSESIALRDIAADFAKRARASIRTLRPSHSAGDRPRACVCHVPRRVASNPAGKGSILSIYATGAGLMNVPTTDGTITPLTAPYPATQLSIGLEIGDAPATIQYSGAAPGLVAGAIQVNAYVPQGAPLGASVPILLSVGGYPSPSPANSVTIAIQ